MNEDRENLLGHVAVVTGGGAGIGRAAAMALARRGADVAILDIDDERGAQAVGLLEGTGSRALAVHADMRQTDEVTSGIEQVDAHFGRVDILVNNAGGVRPGTFVEQSERSWRRHIEMNLLGMLAATSAAAKAMIRGGRGGAIVNVASIEGNRAAPDLAVYGACKAAQLNFTRSMALELAPHGIRTNAVTPDWVHTPSTAGFMSGLVPDELPPRPPELVRSLAAYVPLGREGRDDECGEVIAFLCSPLASYVNGAILAVDGGTSASAGWTRLPDGSWSMFGSEPSTPQDGWGAPDARATP